MVFSFGIVAYAISLLIRVLLAKNLTVEEFGLFFAMMSLIPFLAIFKNMGLPRATVKLITDSLSKTSNLKVKTIFFTFLFYQISFSLILISVFTILSRYISVSYFKHPAAVILFPILLFYLLTSSLPVAAKSLFLSFQNIRWVSFVELLTNLFTLLIIIILLRLNFGLLAPVYGFVFGGVLAFVLFFFPMYKHLKGLKVNVKNFLPATKGLFSFGIPVSFVGFGEMIILYVDILLLTFFSTLFSVGVYSAVLPIAMLFLFFSRSISAVLFSAVAKLHSKGESDKIVLGMKHLHTYLLVVVIPIILTFFVYAKEIILLLFGQEYLSGIIPFKILLAGVIFYLIATNNYDAISGIGKPSKTAKIILFTSLINLGLNLILIPMFDIIGAAIATTISYIFALVYSSVQLRRLIPITIPWLNWFKTFVSGGIYVAFMMLTLKVLSNFYLLSIIVSPIIAGLVYLVVIFKLKIIDYKESKGLLKNVLSKQN